MKKYIMAIDQGTTSSRAVLVNKLGELVESASFEFPQIYPCGGFVEHNPRDIFDSVIKSMRACIEKAKISANEIDCIGITNQRETTIVWNKESGEPIANAIVWQCRRTANYCAKLKEKGFEKMIADKTGLTLDAYFSASKINWLLNNIDGAKADALNGKLLFGTVDTFLLWKFTKGKIFATDYTNASRTMLFNIHSLKYDDELLKLFEVPRSMLAEAYPSSNFYGFLDKEFLGAEIPITGLAGDQQSALFGQMCFDEGDVKNTYGTGGFLLMNTGKKCIDSKRGLITTLAASGGDRPDFVLEGSIFIAGAAIKWLRDELKLITSASETCEIANKVPNTGGVYFVPAFVGLGAPHWDSEARGMICGITRGTTKEHIVRATLESIAFQVFDVLHAMERDTSLVIKKIKVDGGACANDFLMQFQADILQQELIRPLFCETTALGAAYLAGLKSGFFESVESLKNNERAMTKFKSSITRVERDSLVMGWEKAIFRAKAK